MTVLDEASLLPHQVDRFRQFLSEQTGLLFDPQRQGMLCSGLVARMAERGIESPDEYYEFLRYGGEARSELKSLAELVTIGETYFFRNQPHFDILREHLIPGLVAERPAQWRNLRVWSAACSTGEEPYTIAMILRELLPASQEWNLSILATDINREHLRRAREAVYNERAVRFVPEAWREKYFVQRHGRFYLSDDVKRLVQFEEHNLVGDSYDHPGMQAVDFLFCRNVTIYFGLDTTRRVMDRLSHCVDRNGFLFIGDAETLWQISEKFAPVEFPRAFVYRVAEPGTTPRIPIAWPEPPAPAARSTLALPPVLAPAPAPMAVPEPPARVEPTVPAPSSLEPIYDRAREAARRKDFTAALEDFEAVLQRNAAHLGARLGRASILADQGESEAAIRDLLQVIRADNLASEAYYLLGTLNAKTGRLDEAVAAFQRAIYAEASAPLAYHALANAYRQQGRPAKARRELQNALKALENATDDEVVRFSEDITAENLRAVCRQALAQMPGA